MAWDVIIAGGGFGGFYAARTLARVLPSQSARVRLVTEDNFMLYTPLLPGAASGAPAPRPAVPGLPRAPRHRGQLHALHAVAAGGGVGHAGAASRRRPAARGAR